jgi:ribonuclease P protein component
MDVMKKGRVYTSSLFIVRVLVDNGSSWSISAVSTKKVAPTAVKRNYLRRQTYEAIEPLSLSIKNGVRAIVFAKKEATQSSFDALKHDLKELFVKAKISV